MIGIKPIHEQVDDLISSVETSNDERFDANAPILVLKVFQLQVDNLNRVRLTKDTPEYNVQCLN